MHATRQVFQIDLVHDAKTRRYHAKGVKRLHAPLHELVALVVALKLQLHVQVKRVLFTVVVDHDGVVHHQINWHQWLNELWVFTQLNGHTAHGGQVSEQGHTGKVLQHHARHHKRNFLRPAGIGLPVGQLGNVLGSHALAVAVAQHRFKHDAQGYRQAPDTRKLFGKCWQRIKLAHLARRSFERFQGRRKSVLGSAVGLGRWCSHSELLVINGQPLFWQAADRCTSTGEADLH